MAEENQEKTRITIDIPHKRRKTPNYFKIWLKTFLTAFNDLPQEANIDEILFSWNKKLIHFVINVIISGILISTALFRFVKYSSYTDAIISIISYGIAYYILLKTYKEFKKVK